MTSSVGNTFEISRDVSHTAVPKWRATVDEDGRSLWHYDAAARHALQSVNLRRPAILHYASWAVVFPISQGGPVTPDGGPDAQSWDRRDVPFAGISLDPCRAI